MSTVLWGARRHDVQYGSRQFWRTHIPIDPTVSTVTMGSFAYFDVGDCVLLRSGRAPQYGGRIVGMDPPAMQIGVRL